MRSFVVRGLLAAAVAVLVGCASGPPEAEWPEQLVSIDDMRATSPWVAKVPLPAKDLVRDRSRNSTVVLHVHVAADGTVQRAGVGAGPAFSALLRERHGPASHRGGPHDLQVLRPAPVSFAM